MFVAQGIINIVVTTMLLLNIVPNAAAIIGSPRSEIVPYEHWNCGASDFDRSLSHQLSKEDCPKRMYEADLCCVVHDLCYMDDRRGGGQHECDEEFCHCLERTVAQSAKQRNQSQIHTSATNTKDDGCTTVSNSFCEIVKLFGASAYATARKLADKQKLALETWEKKVKAEVEEGKPAISKENVAGSSTNTVPPTTTTIITTPTPTASLLSSITTTTTTAPSTTTPSPAEIGHFVTHSFPVNCLDQNLSKCTKQLHQCTAEHLHQSSSSHHQFTNSNPGSDTIDVDAATGIALSAKLAECSAQFCKCASQWSMFEHGNNNNNNENENAFLSASLSPRFLPFLANKKLISENADDECAESLLTVCNSQLFTGLPVVNIWSIDVVNNINYIGHMTLMSLALAMGGSLLLLFLVIVFGFLMTKVFGVFVKKYRRHYGKDDLISRKNYAKSSIRRNTLTALRTIAGGGGGTEDDEEKETALERGRPLYMPLGVHHHHTHHCHQKCSIDSSPSTIDGSEPAAHKLLGIGINCCCTHCSNSSAGVSAVHPHHHHQQNGEKSSSGHSPNKNHHLQLHVSAHQQQNKMPLNSSQQHLMANSSSTLSSDMSSSSASCS